MSTKPQSYVQPTDELGAALNGVRSRVEVLELRAPTPGPKGDTGPQGPQGPAGPLNPNATNSRYADGPSSTAYSRDVSGGGYFAVWMDSGLMFGRNVSSIRYKTNVRDHGVDPVKVLALRPVLYDRRTEGEPTDDDRDDYGLIAEEVVELVPELVTYYEGEVDGVRYDLLAVALLDVCKSLARRIEALEGA